MSRTSKDNRRTAKVFAHKTEEPIRKEFADFKRRGPKESEDHCPDCGGLTDFDGGFLVCCECGWNDCGVASLDQHFSECA